ncbi:TPA: hypothetical protein HA361_01805 [Candidatus Woesearchaeota archaeon]|nr:hypothetical protein [Candidatus Woesearchaeota archaeon]
MAEQTILFCSQDAGGTNALFPVVKEIAKKRLYHWEYLACGTGKKILITESIFFEEGDSLNEDYIGHFMDSLLPSIVVLGTSQGYSMEKKVLRQSLERNIPSVSVIDYWSNYRQRFSGHEKGGLMLPSCICVVDELMKQEMIAEGFDPSLLVVTGNPFFSTYAQSQVRGAASNAPFLFLSQPFSEISTSFDPGYDEFQVLTDVLSSLEYIRKHSPFSVLLVVRPHPREDPDKYSRFLDSVRHTFPVKVEAHTPLSTLIGGARAVIGMSSAGLLEAALRGKPAISYQPNVQKDISILHKLRVAATITSKEALSKALLRPAAPDVALLREHYTDRESIYRVIGTIQDCIPAHR